MKRIALQQLIFIYRFKVTDNIVRIITKSFYSLVHRAETQKTDTYFYLLALNLFSCNFALYSFQFEVNQEKIYEIDNVG